MFVRVVSLTLAPILVLLTAASPALASDADTRAAQEHALQAQIDRIDVDVQNLETRLHDLETGHAASTSRAADESELRTQIHRMDREQELLEDRLHAIEKQDSPAVQDARRQAKIDAEDRLEAGNPPAPAPTPAPARTSETAPAPAQSTPPPAPPLPATPSAPAPPPPLGPPLRQAADPAPYEKVAGAWVGMFRYNPYRWVPVGTHQLVVYNTYDEAYLLDFASDCPGLLSAKRIQVENFSTKVVMGRDAVVADGQRCPITGIRQLMVNRLP